MKAWKVQLITVSVLFLLYFGVVQLFFPLEIKSTNVTAMLVVFVVFLLSSWIMSAGKQVDPEARTQRFILGTTLQMLVALFYVLIVKFVVPKDFKGMVVHFMTLFVLLLAAQATLLVMQVRKKQ